MNNLEIPDIYAIRSANLKIILVALGRGGKKKLSIKMGGAANYLSQIDSKSKRVGLKNIGPNIARSIETAARELGLDWVQGNWMDTPHTSNGSNDYALGQAPYRPANPVKVLSWAKAGGLEGMMTLEGALKEDVETVNAPHWAGRGTFALQVRGDSMVNPAGMPSFPAGCIIFVDPTREAEDGYPVIVKLPETDEPVFKMLDIYDGKKQLKPLNPRYPITPYPDGARTIGVVISMSYDTVPAPKG